MMRSTALLLTSIFTVSAPALAQDMEGVEPLDRADALEEVDPLDLLEQAGMELPERLETGCVVLQISLVVGARETLGSPRPGGARPSPNFEASESQALTRHPGQRPRLIQLRRQGPPLDTTAAQPTFLT